MAIKFCETATVFECTECGSKMIVDSDEQQPDECSLCGIGERKDKFMLLCLNSSIDNSKCDKDHHVNDCNQNCADFFEVPF